MLVLRAGALGDLLLLRPTLAALRASGHRVHLLAPLAPGRALVGPGAADTLHASDGPELAAALADGFADGPHRPRAGRGRRRSSRTRAARRFSSGSRSARGG